MFFMHGFTTYISSLPILIKLLFTHILIKTSYCAAGPKHSYNILPTGSSTKNQYQLHFKFIA